jgi:hypothetical protein
VWLHHYDRSEAIALPLQLPAHANTGDPNGPVALQPSHRTELAQAGPLLVIAHGHEQATEIAINEPVKRRHAGDQHASLFRWLITAVQGTGGVNCFGPDLLA